MQPYLASAKSVRDLFLHYFPSQEDFTLKEKNLLLSEQILSFESKPQFGRALSVREANRKLLLVK